MDSASCALSSRFLQCEIYVGVKKGKRLLPCRRQYVPYEKASL